MGSFYTAQLFKLTRANLSVLGLIMASLRSKCGHYIFVLWFLLSSFWPNLSGRRVDVYHTSTHGVALVRI